SARSSPASASPPPPSRRSPSSSPASRSSPPGDRLGSPPDFHRKERMAAARAPSLGSTSSNLEEDRMLPFQMARVQMPDDETAWSAVLERDALSDGQFVYAVSSTGVYCRPSCTSRRPRRDLVSFFADTRQSEATGYLD